MVAGTSAMRSGVIWSTARHLTQTRAGGRWRVPHAVHRLAAKPNFQRLGRGATAAPPGGSRIGPARRLAVEQAAPGEERGVGQVVAARRDLLRPPAPRCRPRASAVGRPQDRHVGAVGQRDHMTTRRAAPGRGRRPGAGPAWAAPVLPIAAGEVVGERLGPRHRGWPRACTRAGVQARPRATVVNVAGGHAGLLQRVGDRGLGQRAVDVLAEALLPLPRGRVAGHRASGRGTRR